MMRCAFQRTLRVVGFVKSYHNNSFPPKSSMKFSKQGKKKDSVQCIITGFSRFASRADLLGVLGSVEPSKIDFRLDNHFLPTGEYLLTLPENKSLEDVRSKLIKTFANQYAVTVADKTSQWSLASSVNINNWTVRCKTMNRNVDMDDLHFLFEEFGFQKSGSIIKLKSDKEGYFLLHFNSSEEACRAVTEKSLEVMRGERIELYWYQN